MWFVKGFFEISSKNFQGVVSVLPLPTLVSAQPLPLDCIYYTTSLLICQYFSTNFCEWFRRMTSKSFHEREGEFPLPPFPIR